MRNRERPTVRRGSIDSRGPARMVRLIMLPQPLSRHAIMTTMITFMSDL